MDDMSEFARDIYQLCINRGQSAESAKRSALSDEDQARAILRRDTNEH